MEINQTSSVKWNMKGRKLRSGVNWQGVLKHKRRETDVHKARPLLLKNL